MHRRWMHLMIRTTLMHLSTLNQPPLNLSFLNFSYRNSFETLSLRNVPIIENIQDHDAYMIIHLTERIISILVSSHIKILGLSSFTTILDFCYSTISLSNKPARTWKIKDETWKIYMSYYMLTLTLVKTQKPNYFSYACIFIPLFSFAISNVLLSSAWVLVIEGETL